MTTSPKQRKYWALVSLRKPKVFVLQFLQCYLMKEDHIQKFVLLFNTEKKNLVFENLKGSHIRKFLGFRKL